MGLAHLFRAPLFQFLVLGAAFYAAYAWLHDDPAPRDADTIIRVSAADVSRLDAAWRAKWKRAPTGEELAGVVKNHAREIALHRHAVALGLDQGDLVLRRMLGRKLEGMIQNLVELGLSPTDEDLRAHYDAHPGRFRSPDRITLTHVFLDPDKRGKKTLADADVILKKLRALDRPTEGIEGVGDAFMLQRYYPRKTEPEIARQFGQEFARSAFRLAPEAWHGPVLSGYGVHLVYVHALEQGVRPDFEQVRDRVQQDWMDVTRTKVQDDYVNEVLSRYEVVLEDPEGQAAAPSGETRAGGD